MFLHFFSDIDSSLLNWFYYTKSWLDVLKENSDNIHCLTFEDLKEVFLFLFKMILIIP